MLEHGVEGVKKLDGHYDERLLGRFALGPLVPGSGWRFARRSESLVTSPLSWRLVRGRQWCAGASCRAGCCGIRCFWTGVLQSLQAHLLRRARSP